MKRDALVIMTAVMLAGLFTGVFGIEPVILSAAAKPIEIKIANFQPPLHKSNEMLKNWAERIEKETNGKVKFILYPGSTLAKAKDTYDAVVNGIADMCWTFAGYTRGRFHLAEAVVQPLGFRNAEHGARVLWDLYQKFPEIRAEFKDTHLLFLTPSSHRQIHSKKAIRKLEDFKGQKTRVPSSEAPHVKALGGVPVSMRGPDVYLGLERGVIDADFHPWETAYSYKWYEVVRYHTKADLYLAGLFIATMNINTWNKLPDDVKKVIDKYSGKYGFVEVSAKGMWDKYDDYYLQWLKKNTSNEIIYWSDAEKNKAWETMKVPVVEKWVQTAEAKGLPGRKILNETIRLMEKY
ncbi:TRAP transporter substrate-binding protein [Thermodesulfobacteriota bacterium]